MNIKEVAAYLFITRNTAQKMAEGKKSQWL